MKSLLEKLNYKGQERIAIINAAADLMPLFSEELKGVVVDSEIDPRFPYAFAVLFVSRKEEVDKLAPVVIHNLRADGVLWFCYPKGNNGNQSNRLDRDHGWDTLNESGFRGIRIVAVDKKWSALRFRNVKYIKTKKTSQQDK